MNKILLPGLMVVFASLSLVMLGSIAPTLVSRQLFLFLLGFAGYFGAQALPFAFFQRSAKWGYVFFTLLLMLTFLVGQTSKGSTRWISLGVTEIQPSQMLKPFFALYLAVTASLGMKTFRALGTYLLLSGIPVGLVFFQPDFGTSVVLAAIAGSILLFSTVPKRYLLGLAVFAVLAMTVGWNALLKDYQRQRIESFISPAEDVQGASYHAEQAVIAVGSGKLFGRGLGHGVQSHLRFLPEKQTDFMFASLSEEMGFAGSVGIILLYGFFFAVLLGILRRMRRTVPFLAVLGIVSMLLVQTAINIGMNIGLLPITGITLPLLSYGGSSILAVGVSLGIVMSASKTSSKVSTIEIR